MSLQNINTYTYSPGFQIGQYHNAVLCISCNVQNLYLDGTLIATKTGSANVLANYSTINQIMIGCAGDKSSGFSGYLDDFRMYNYTLNQTQVSNLYINRNIVAYYPFDNSLNSQTPNYATLTYDATFVGNAATISTSSGNYKIGGGALQITNTTGSATKSYVTSSSGFSTSTTNGLSVSLWFKASGVASTRMRLFDLCTALGSQGISVDINGTNQILAGNGYYIPPIIIPTFQNVYTNLPLFTKAVISATTPITSVSDLGTNPQTINIVAGTGNGVAYQPGNSYTSTNLGKLYPVFFDSYYANTSNNINFNFIDQSEFTISLWVLIGGPGYDISNFFRINNGTSDVLVMNASNNTNNMSLVTGGLTITTPYTKNTVNYHIAFTVNKTLGITLYKNGASVGYANGTIAFTGTTFTAFLQGYGQIFNFKYYNNILTSTEITALYNTEV